MSTLYCTAMRTIPLNSQELKSIHDIVSHAIQNKTIIILAEQGGGEIFEVSIEKNDPKIILNSATRLPDSLFDTHIDDFIYVVEHWLHLLSDIRITIPMDEWLVSIDDKPIRWDSINQKYDVLK